MVKSMSTNTSTDSVSNSQKLGLIALVSIVVSSMIGSGVDSLPQNMAAHSAVGPVVIAWLVCGFGMYFIARTFIVLSDIRPDLQAGIYMYAREGFGPFPAFISAWGYWLMTIFSNIAFAIMVMDTLDYFFPGDFTGGNNIPSLIGASLLIWAYNYLILRGVKSAGIVNLFGTVAKLIPLVAFIGILVYLLDASKLTADIWGHSPVDDHPKLGSIFSQVILPLDVALWCFIGVEGAVALSGRARKKEDVGKATLIGFIVSLVICILVSVLPFGILTQPELKQIPTPSAAGVLKAATGDWGAWMINIGVLISVLTSWVAWTMICAEVPMVAAKNKTFPKAFAKTNQKGSASVSLWVSSTIMQFVVLLVYFSTDAWLTMLGITAVTVLPAYLASAAYLLKLCLTKEYDQYAPKGRVFSLLTSLIGLFFCGFMFYASPIEYVVLTPLILSCGIPVFIWARKEQKTNEAIFTKPETIGLLVLLILDVIAIVLYATGFIKF